jgi:hypothetical protein
VPSNYHYEESIKEKKKKNKKKKKKKKKKRTHVGHPMMRFLAIVELARSEQTIELMW